jgi:hypothetical protein
MVPRIDDFFEFLKSEQLEPRTGDRAEQIWFNFQGELFELFVSEDDDVIMFRQGVVADEFPDVAFVARAVNKIHIRYSLVTAWYYPSYAVTSVSLLCELPVQLRPNLYRILEQLDSATVRLKTLLFDDGALELDDVDDLDLIKEDVSENDTASVEITEPSRPREALLMNPFSDTGKKLRWQGEVNDESFTLYIPKWRIPTPWPKQIVVAVSTMPLDIHEISVPTQGEEAEPLDSRLPIITMVDLEYRCKHSVRYRPVGDPKTWEIGTPYIPNSLLPADIPHRLQLEVRWDYSAGNWSPA